MSFSYGLEYPYINNSQYPLTLNMSKYDLPLDSNYSVFSPQTSFNSYGYNFSPSFNGTSVNSSADNTPITLNPNGNVDTINNQSLLNTNENEPITLNLDKSMSNYDVSFTNECIGGGMMAATMVAPKLLTFKETTKAIPKTVELMGDVSAQTKTFAGATETAKTFSNLHNSFRLENSIKSVERASSETAKIINKIASIQKQYVKTNNPIIKAQLEAELKTLVDLSKKPGWFARTFLKSTPKTLTEILPKMKTAGVAAAKAAKATEVANLAAKGSNVLKCANWVKSALKIGGFWFMLALEVFSQYDEVSEAFSKGGPAEGTKQTAKSLANVTTSVGGFCVGAKAGAEIGGIIGSFIFPGVGSAIGAGIGLAIGGAIGMYAAKKVARAVIGENFSEKQAKLDAVKAANEQAATQNTSEASNLNKTEPIQQNTNTQTTTQPTNNDTDATKQARAIIEQDRIAALQRYFNGTSSPAEKAIFDEEWDKATAKTQAKMGVPDFSQYVYC